jgi:hypothetical protein
MPPGRELTQRMHFAASAADPSEAVAESKAWCRAPGTAAATGRHPNAMINVLFEPVRRSADQRGDRGQGGLCIVHHVSLRGLR